MAQFQQLNPALPLWVPSKRQGGWAHFLSWDSIEHSLYWVIWLDDGTVWTVPNEKVRTYRNWTAERADVDNPPPPQKLPKSLRKLRRK